MLQRIMNRNRNSTHPQITLVTGGARSGKSRFAQRLAEAKEGTLLYIATAAAFDDEMQARIARHQADRGARWETHEVEVDLPTAIAQAASDTILVDCLTIWLSNLMLAGEDIDAWVAALESSLERCGHTVILVTNEVGSGIVPETPLGRAFRDEAGRLNQRIATLADNVSLVVAGLPLWLKQEIAG